MSREVFEELKQDEAFVEKVANRIYIESDDFEDSMSETEWICEMTDIADKYIQRFKLAFKLANKVSNQPTLNENQQIAINNSKKSFEKGADLYDCAIDMVLYDGLTDKEWAKATLAFLLWAQEQEADNE